jgi:MOSC domain-containing protein YiiM
MATVVSINVSGGGIPKIPVQSCDVLVTGLAEDRHDHGKHTSLDRAVSLVDLETLNQLNKEGYDVCPGAIGENLTVENLQLQSLEPGDNLTFSGGVRIELVEARKPCFVLDALDVKLKTDIVGRCGYLARVIVEGTISAGESITVTKASPA